MVDWFRRRGGNKEPENDAGPDPAASFDASGEPVVGQDVVLLQRPYRANRFSRVTGAQAKT